MGETQGAARCSERSPVFGTEAGVKTLLWKIRYCRTLYISPFFFWMWTVVDGGLKCHECHKGPTVALPFYRCLHCDESYTGMTGSAIKEMDRIQAERDGE